MGSDAHVLVTAEPPHRAEQLADQAQARVADLEARWSRFRPTSEVSQINQASPRPIPVSPETIELAQRAIDAARETGGRFDASQLPALMAAGYDRTFTELADRTDSPSPVAQPAPNGPPFGANSMIDIGQGPAPWPGGYGPGGSLLVDAEAGTVAVQPGHGLDPGGIGKGLAADIVSRELQAAGATGVMVSLGGDLRVRGHGPDDGGWPLAVTDPIDPDRELLRLAIDGGAVATSSRLVRRWIDRSGAEAHHLLDPATGAPTATDIVAVTVVASDGWWAEALTKALFTLDADRALGHVHHGSAVIVDRDGRVYATPDLAPLVKPPDQQGLTITDPRPGGIVRSLTVAQP